MTGKFLYSAVAGFFAGVALAFLGVPPRPAAALALLLAGVILFISLLSSRDRRLVLVVVILLAVAGGLLRAGADVGQENETVFNQVLNQPVTAIGIVTKPPAESASGQTVTVALEQVLGAEGGPEIVGESKAVVYAPPFPELHYGDRVRLVGELTKPESFETDSGRIFNYPRWLARAEVFYELARPTVEITERGEGHWLRGSLLSLRRKLLAVLHRQIPDPQAALTGGVLLGAEDALGEKLEGDFRTTGLIHIVVLSGFNVTIVAVAIGAALLFVGLPVAVASGLAGVGVGLFALLVGLTPTVVRASIMAIMALLARIFSRQYAAMRGLVLAAFIMVMINPHILLFDPSFQLSAIATAGLISFGDRVSSWLTALPARFGIREAATATVSAQLAVAPLLVFYTGKLSLISFMANLLVLPVVPVLMATGTATALSGLLLENLALPFAAASYGVASYIFSVVDTLASLSFATATLGRVPLLLVFLSYALLVYGLRRPSAG